jgi:hypothetical protein
VDPTRRAWSLDAACEILVDVRARTESAHAEVEEKMAKREASLAGSPERDAIDAEIRDRVAGWARAMEALGAVVQGPWLVDFDCGKGFYCWRWPEEKLEYFHGYDEGFDGRVRIQ